MIPLAFPFTRDDFSHRLLERAGELCLVERTNDLTGSVHWEVVRLNVEPTKTILGRVSPAHERYPSAERWGERGWTFLSLPEAVQKYRSLVQMAGFEASAGADASPRLPHRRAGGLR